MSPPSGRWVAGRGRVPVSLLASCGRTEAAGAGQGLGPTLGRRGAEGGLQHRSWVCCIFAVGCIAVAHFADALPRREWNGLSLDDAFIFWQQSVAQQRGQEVPVLVKDAEVGSWHSHQARCPHGLCGGSDHDGVPAIVVDQPVLGIQE